MNVCDEHTLIGNQRKKYKNDVQLSAEIFYVSHLNISYRKKASVMEAFILHIIFHRHYTRQRVVLELHRVRVS